MTFLILYLGKIMLFIYLLVLGEEGYAQYGYKETVVRYDITCTTTPLFRLQIPVYEYNAALK